MLICRGETMPDGTFPWFVDQDDGLLELVVQCGCQQPDLPWFSPRGKLKRGGSRFFGTEKRLAASYVYGDLQEIQSD